MAPSSVLRSGQIRTSSPKVRGNWNNGHQVPEAESALEVNCERKADLRTSTWRRRLEGQVCTDPRLNQEWDWEEERIHPENITAKISPSSFFIFHRYTVVLMSLPALIYSLGNWAQRGQYFCHPAGLRHCNSSRGEGKGWEEMHQD